MMERLRDCEPYKHDAEEEPHTAHEVVQVDHASKAETAQCSAHTCWLQLRTSFTCGHSMPPCAACDVTERLRD